VYKDQQEKFKMRSVQTGALYVQVFKPGFVIDIEVSFKAILTWK